jgi:stage II sporulation protein M
MAMVMAVFIIAIVVGFAAVSTDAETGAALMNFLRNEIFVDVGEGSGLVLFAKIFVNNLEACVFLFLGGASLGLITLLIIALNGIVIGGVTGIVGAERGLPFMVAAIIPHGIFEIPAFIIAGALGLSLAQAFWGEIRGTGDMAASAVPLGRTFLTVVLPLVLLAAAIEAFVTPLLISLALYGGP